ncbi:MAG: hypothetical protein ABSC92_00190 [Rhizomicrobium sp.]
MADKDEVRFTVNETASRYLQWLADNRTMGKTPNEVARQILIQRLGEMSGEGYKPPPDFWK